MSRYDNRLAIREDHYIEIHEELVKAFHNLRSTVRLLGVELNNFSDYIEYTAKKGYSLERAAWGLVYLIPSERVNAWFKEVYQYANDNHASKAFIKIITNN